MPTAGKLVIKYLKENGESTLLEIITGTNLTESDVKSSMDEYINSGYIVFDKERGKYKVRFILDPPLPKNRTDETTAWNYSRIKEKLAEMGDAKNPQSLAIPRQWKNPYLGYLPDKIDQGSRGTCVGYSAAIGATLLYYAITKDLPSPTEIANEKRNVEIDLGCPNNKPFLCDEFNRRWKSPQYIYTTSRIVINADFPSGSYVSAAAKSLKLYGSVFETECKTSKSVFCVTEWYPTEKGESTDDAKARIMLSGNMHLTEGYAQVTDFDTLCEAVYTHGFVLIPIDIYENYTSHGYVGNYPDPSGVEVGSHAQCVVGYDLDARTLEFRQSWGTSWSNEGGISERYFNKGAGAAYVILDEHETKIAEQLYSTITITSNVSCTYVVNNENHTVSNLTVVLERGVQHTITATPVDPSSVVQPSLSTTITPTGDTGTVSFGFDPVVVPVVKKSLIELIIEFIESIIAMFRKK
jgi:hypothetical protein